MTEKKKTSIKIYLDISFKKAEQNRSFLRSSFAYQTRKLRV